MPARRKRQPRGVVDTSVLVAGIAAFKQGRAAKNPSARFLHDWIDRGTFVWLVSEEILDEYREVLQRLGVRRAVIGRLMNLLGEEAKHVLARGSSELSPDPSDEPFCACAESAAADFIVTLNPRDFPQRRLRARVLAPGDRLPSLTRPRASRRIRP